MITINKKIKADKKGTISIDGGNLFSDKEVRVIVILEDEEDEISEKEWLKFASKNSVFDFLNDEPDLYTLNDGVPYTRHL